MTCSISVLSRSGENERAGGLAAQRPSDCRAERLLLVPLPQRLLVADCRHRRMSAFLPDIARPVYDKSPDSCRDFAFICASSVISHFPFVALIA